MELQEFIDIVAANGAKWCGLHRVFYQDECPDCKKAADIVTRLRAVHDCETAPTECFYDSGPCCGAHDWAHGYPKLMQEAADEIERLRAHAATQEPR